jgi:NADH-quinone oxidoreductase subunit M
MLATVIAGVLLSILTAGYGLWTVRRIFYGELPEKYSQAHDPNWKMLFPIVLVVLLAVVVGIYPNPIIDLISAIVKGFFG